MSNRSEEIMDAAIEILAKKGYYNTKISEIVKKVEIAKGTFYLYYNSKKDLFLNIIREYSFLLDNNVDFEILNNEELSLKGILVEFIGDFLTFINENKNLAIIIQREAVSVDDEFLEEYKKLDDVIVRHLRIIYDSLIECDKISIENDFEFFTHIYAGVINSYILRNYIIRGKEIEVDKLSIKTAEHIARALKK